MKKNNHPETVYTGTGFLTILHNLEKEDTEWFNIASDFTTSAAVLKAVVDYCLLKRDPAAKEPYSDFVSPCISSLLGGATMLVGILTSKSKVHPFPLCSLQWEGG
jgi:hypothetical protein